MKHFLFLLLLATAANAYAQQCDQFDNLLKKGDAHLKGKKPDYQEAINAYTAAILACSDRAGEAQKRLAKMVSDINKLKENALAAERKATEAQKETEMALLTVKEEQVKTRVALARSDSLYEVADAERRRAEAAEKTAKEEAENTKKALGNLEIQKARTDSALAKAEKLIDAFYFYGDRFALAYKHSIFYFINKNGDRVGALGEYDKAKQFDETGFAKVRKEGTEYLLDTFGTTYPVAYTLAGLNERIIALDLRGTRLNSFPAEILLHPQLEVLILNGEYQEKNKIMMPPGIEELPRLKSLHLSHCQLKNLPAEIGQLQNLQSLNLDRNKLSSLPAEIGQLQNLQSLDLSGNQLSSLPAEIGQLQNLQFLDLFPNQLSSLPAEIGQLQNLQFLNLRGNQLSSLPAEIGQLINLQSLDLSGNQLSSLPAEIGQLNNLQTLQLDQNQLSSLPAEIGQLINLQSLNLRGNQLSNLPAEIGQLINLQTLYLSYNQLSSLPAEIRSMKFLKELYLWENPFSAPYIEQLRKDMPWCEIRF